MGQSNDGAQLPQRDGVRWYFVVAPKGTSTLRATLLANTFLGVWTHWQGRDYSCTGTASCWRCKDGEPNRWTGFIAAYSWYEKKPVVLRLTEGAARQIQDLVNQHGSARGLTVDLKRVYMSKENSKVGVTFVRREDDRQVPGEHPIRDSVNRMLGINDAWYIAQANGRGPIEEHQLSPRPVEDEPMPLPPDETDEQFVIRLRARLQREDSARNGEVH